MGDRERMLLGDLPRGAKVIEIGPSYNPLAPKRDGWNTTVVDHETRDGLIAKYAQDPNVDTARIEEVDFVWHGGSLVELVGEARRGSYDAFLASHVIEHVTDVVSFLRSAQELIGPEGVIVLAVPDKRKCFDFFRPLSTTGDAVVAFEEKRQRHNAKTQFEYAMYMSNRSGSPGWAIDTTAPAVLACHIEDGLNHMRLADRSEYVDAHSWTFVPASFELMILELKALKLLDLRVERCEEAYSTEFFARLRPDPEPSDRAAVQARRWELLNRIVVEQAEASRQVPGSPLAQYAERERAAAEALAAVPPPAAPRRRFGWPLRR